MNRKRILGITALLALVAMCLMFVACPEDPGQDVEAIFTNNSSYDIYVTFTGGNPSESSIELAARGGLSGKADSKSVKINTVKTSIYWTVKDVEIGSGGPGYYLLTTGNGAGITFSNNPEGPAQDKISTIPQD